MTQRRPSILRRKYLLNWRFQVKYTLMFLVLAAVVAGILGVRLFATVRENSQLISMDNSDANALIQAQLQQQDLRVLYEIVALLAGMVGAIAVVGVIVTHQVAGPALVLTRNLNELAQGRLPALRPLRKGDELHELFEALHAAVGKLQGDFSSAAQVMERVRAAAAGRAEFSAIEQEISAVLARLKEYQPKAESS